MTTHKEQRQHRYSWHTYTWPLTRNRDYIDIPDEHIHDHTTRNRDNIDIPDRHIHDHSQGTETTSIFLTDIYMTTHKEQRQHRYSWHIYMTTHKEQRLHRNSWQTYTWPLTRNRDNIDIPDTHIHDHSQGTEATSIFLTDIYMTTHKEQRQHRYSWQTYTWPLTRNRDNIDIPDTHIHDHSQGTETTSIFLTHIYMTTHIEQRQHRYSWYTYIHDHSQWTETTSIFLTHIYTWPLTRNRDNINIPDTHIHDHAARNRDNIDIPDRHIHDHSPGTETTSIFLTDIYMTTHKEQRQHRYCWHTYTWPLTRNRDYIDIPDRHIHEHSQGTETTSIFLTDIYMTTHKEHTTSIFLTHIYMTTHKEQRQQRYSWHIYTWPLTRNRDNIDIPDTHIYMTTHKEQRQHLYSWHIYTWPHNKEQRLHRYSWHTYTWPLTWNRDKTDIPDTYIYMTTQKGIETTSIFLTDIYITTHKEQRQHRYSWQTYTWPLTRNRDYIYIPDRHILDHSQGTETTSIFLTHIYMTTHKEQRQHLYSWHIYIHDHWQGTETTSIYLTHIYMTTHKEQRQHRYSWHTYTWPRSKEQRQHRYSWQTYTWPLTRNRDYIDIADRHIYDHSQGAETT